MRANVVIFTYKASRDKKNDIKLPRIFADDQDYTRIVEDTNALFGKPDELTVIRDCEIPPDGRSYSFDVKRLTGKDLRDSSPS